MDLCGEVRIAAPPASVWGALNDTDVLRACIRGCESIERLSDTELVAKMSAKVGPLKARFNTDLYLSNLDPPRSYTLSGEGRGAVGFARGSADVSLEENAGVTILRYTGTMQIGGKLARVGARLLDRAVRKVFHGFFANLVARFA